LPNETSQESDNWSQRNHLFTLSHFLGKKRKRNDQFPFLEKQTKLLNFLTFKRFTAHYIIESSFIWNFIGNYAANFSWTKLIGKILKRHIGASITILSAIKVGHLEDRAFN